jgi:hypothetical protein
MALQRIAIGAFTRLLAATAVLGVATVGAPSAMAAATALSSAQLVDARTLAELIVDAAQQANATRDNLSTPADETRLAIEAAIEATIEGFQGGQADPGVVAEALFLAKAKMLAAGDWCPSNPTSTKPSMKSRAAPELARTCSMSTAFNSIGTIVEGADNGLPASNGGGANPFGPPPPTGAGGSGGTVVYAGVK